jgi:transcriptional regulator with XRE-family HTH domain
MGRGARYRPIRLAEKLKQIRESLGLSQNGIIIRLKVDIKRSDISNYESDINEPPLNVLLAYARLANVYMDVLADDELDLPDELPSKRTSLGKRKKITKQ